MATDTIATFIRRERPRLVQRWYDEVLKDVPALRAMSEPAVRDHIHEFLGELADWTEGSAAHTAHTFEALMHGHALQRMGFSIGIELVTREYSRLRTVLLRELLPLATDDAQRAMLARLDEGIDHAMGEAARRYALHREQLRDRFIGILGHDLRDPLGTISIAATMVRDSPRVAPEDHRLVERICRAAERMERMINDVLEFARGHLGGGIPSEPTPNDMAEICRAVVADHMAGHARLPIRVETVGDLRGPFDRDRVMQALANLLGNALQHATGGVELRAWETDDKQAVMTAVRNEGPEIPAGVRARIFDPFVSTNTRKGLGLGLYIVQQIALAHGGICEVSSQDGVTSFAIRWPRASSRLDDPAHLMQGSSA